MSEMFPQNQEARDFFSSHPKSPWEEVPWDIPDNGETTPRYLREGPLPPPVGWLLHDYPYPSAKDSGFTPQPLRPIRMWSDGENSVNSSSLLDNLGFEKKYANQVTSEGFRRNYFLFRESTERWLWKHGVLRLGMPLRSQQPVYFMYTGQFSPLPQESRKQTIGLPMSALPTDQMTFTIYDSFHNYAKYLGEPFENTPDDTTPLVLTWREINELRQDPATKELMTRGEGGSPYIECQFWDLDHKLIRIISGTEYAEEL